MTAIACVTTEVSDLDAFDSIPMNRVVPYPSESELRERAFDVILVDVGFDPASDEAASEAESLRERRRKLRRRLRRLATAAGATVLTRATGRFGALDSSVSEDSAVAAQADYALRIELTRYAATHTWTPPFKFLWQTPEEVVGREGTCTHRAEIAFGLEVVDLEADDRVIEAFRIAHYVENEVKDLDDSCPRTAADREALFAKALDESMSCLRAPLDRLLAPRGHVMAHRMAPDGEQNLFLISLGTTQGLEYRESIDVRREQHASTPAGEAWRMERVIASGVVTDQIDAESAWVAIDVARASEEILEGDVVRPVLEEGLLSSLSGPNCKAILESR